MIRSILGSIWVPAWLQFGSQRPPKSYHKSIPRGINFVDRFLHRFFIDLGSFLEANLGPCWRLFRPKWGDPVGRQPVFCWVDVIFRFVGRPGPFLAPFWGGQGSIFRFFGRFWGRLASIFDPLNLQNR